MIFLWFTIYFVAGIKTHAWHEILYWSVFIVFIGLADRIMLILSREPGLIIAVTIVSALIAGALIYLLLNLRLGIIDKKQRMTIAGIYSGTYLIFKLVLS